MKRTVVVLAIGLGMVIWLASPLLTGRREPWDAHGPYYGLALLGAGLLTGSLEPHRFWIGPIGIYAGQCLAIFMLAWFYHDGLGLFIPLGMIMLVFFTPLSLVGSLAGSWLRRWIGK